MLFWQQGFYGKIFREAISLQQVLFQKRRSWFCEIVCFLQNVLFFTSLEQFWPRFSFHVNSLSLYNGLCGQVTVAPCDENYEDQIVEIGVVLANQTILPLMLGRLPTVLGIRICIRIRIRMSLDLPDPHPDPLVTSTDPTPVPDPSIIKQKQ